MKDSSSYTYIYPGTIEASNSNSKGVTISNIIDDTGIGSPGIKIFGNNSYMMLKPTGIELDGNGNYWYSTRSATGSYTLVTGLKDALSYIPVSSTTVTNNTSYHYIKFPNTKYAIIWYKNNGSMSGSNIKQFEIKIPFALTDPTVSINGGIAGTINSVVAYTQLDSGSTVGQYYLIDESGGTNSRDTWAYITVCGTYR